VSRKWRNSYQNEVDDEMKGLDLVRCCRKARERKKKWKMFIMQNAMLTVFVWGCMVLSLYSIG